MHQTPHDENGRSSAVRYAVFSGSALAVTLCIAAIIIGIVNLDWGGGGPATIGKSAVAGETDAPIATLVDSTDVVWNDATYRIGDALPAGMVRIKSGQAMIEFASGAKITLEGPAEFRIDDPMNAYLQLGKLEANVPDKAIGFTIGAPGLKVIDQGDHVERRKSKAEGDGDDVPADPIQLAERAIAMMF